jgi:hypothetical protein
MDKCLDLLEFLLFFVCEFFGVSLYNRVHTIAEYSQVVDIEVFSEFFIVLAEFVVECLECCRTHGDDIVEYICDIKKLHVEKVFMY